MGSRFTFVTNGREAALAQAARAAGGKDVALGGGANLARQYLIAGLVDEMEISLVPTLLGFGERLFDGVGDDLHALALVITCAGEYRGRRTSMTRRRTLSTSRSRRLHFDVSVQTVRRVCGSLRRPPVASFDDELILDVGREGRPLRRVGRAGGLRTRVARGVQLAAVIGKREDHDG